MSLRAIAPGPSATVQDGGRYGFRAYGVPVSGPFDRTSAAIANALVGNVAGAAVLELNGFGGIYEAESSIAIGLAGAAMPARIESPDRPGRALIIPCATMLRRGDRLILGAATAGFRLYLAVGGGLLAPEILGSRSDERPIAAGDLLPAGSSRTAESRTTIGPTGLANSLIRYVDGPDGRLIGSATLEHRDYRVGRESNRMGVRLEGDRIAVDSFVDRLSSPVTPGAIQLAGGLPIVLGPACGTMGGYPHIGSVLSADLDLVAQARPGSLVRFRRVGIEDAWRIDSVYRAELAGLALRLATAVGSFAPSPGAEH